MKPKRILIVDDNPIVVKALTNALRSAGYDVFTAMDAPAGISSIRQERPELILLDISFPLGGADQGVDWDGFLIMAWLGRIPEAAGIPIVIISVKPAAEYEQRALQAGARAYFQKPIKMEELLPRIYEILNPGGKAEPTEQPPPGRLSMAPR